MGIYVYDVPSLSSADYFLMRNGEFSVALIREVERLKVSRLTPLSSRTPGLSIIREQDLALCILRASLGTSAEHDPIISMSRLRFKLPSGSLRPHLPHLASRADLSHISSRPPAPVDFSTTLLGVPLELTYNLDWPLDLFLAPSDIQTYSQLFSYFVSIRHIHHRVMNCWISLSSAQRRRGRWMGLRENGDLEDGRQRHILLRNTWEVVRQLLWFWDNLWSYVCLDVVGGHFKRLKEVLGYPMSRSRRRSSSASGAMTPSAAATEVPDEVETSEFGSLHPGIGRSGKRADRGKRDAAPPMDFATLRALHRTYLYSLTAGSLLSNAACSNTIKTIMDICEVFVASVERWGGDVLPDLLEEGSIVSQDNGVGKLVLERSRIVRDINEVRLIVLSLELSP